MVAAYDQLFGLELAQLAVDSWTTKAPCGGQVAGRSPVDRRKQGLKRSVAVEAGGIPLVVAFWLALASAVLVCGRLIRRAWTHYRWEGRPRRRP